MAVIKYIWEHRVYLGKEGYFGNVCIKKWLLL